MDNLPTFSPKTGNKREVSEANGIHLKLTVDKYGCLGDWCVVEWQREKTKISSVLKSKKKSTGLIQHPVPKSSLVGLFTNPLADMKRIHHTLATL